MEREQGVKQEVKTEMRMATLQSHPAKAHRAIRKEFGLHPERDRESLKTLFFLMQIFLFQIYKN